MRFFLSDTGVKHTRTGRRRVTRNREGGAGIGTVVTGAGVGAAFSLDSSQCPSLPHTIYQTAAWKATRSARPTVQPLLSVPSHLKR